ncbi:CLUMA_CG015662, isoform A [Clunio marinus]|uniref:CLUMA_CG015662, isoform A n=1 Tax=Clunio marinus TaxID=568069 RepID=A0A1J1IQ34_9DIPT|nr:CLUMA_CG015662, isoform A [Clunio marinus]
MKNIFNEALTKQIQISSYYSCLKFYGFQVSLVENFCIRNVSQWDLLKTERSRVKPISNCPKIDKNEKNVEEIHSA